MKIRSLLILLLSFWIAPLILAQQTPQSLADAELPSLLTIYKDLHSHPELSTKEQRSSEIVAKELRAAGCEVTENFGKYDNPKLISYGVIGVLKNGAGPTVLVRTDLDALPRYEQVHQLTYVTQILNEALRLWPTAPAFSRHPYEDTTIGGRIPVNVSGGLLSKGEPLGASALGQVVELVRQLRGTAGGRQVEGARTGLAHTVGRGANAGVAILTR